MTDAHGSALPPVRTYRARWVLPIAQPPIPHGWVALENDRIAAVGDGHPPAGESVEVGGVLMPGLVNAHIHLELSWMRGQVPPAPSMPQWVRRLMALRRTVGREPDEPIREAVHELRAAGTAVIGDITNTFAAYDALLDSDLAAAVFRELLGFAIADPTPALAAARAEIAALTPVAWLRPSLVPHAPYSVSPALLAAIAAAADTGPLSIHLAESAEEGQFLRDGSGPWRELLTDLKVWDDSWLAPGSGPLDYIARHGLLNDRLLAVHGVQLSNADLGRLRDARATVVTCPRSNRWTGAGLPPIERFYASGVRVAVGTDSLASVEDLNLFSELRLMRELAPTVPAREILASATRHGADALGFGGEYGTIEPGKQAAMIRVDAPAALADVEEYLVSGIQPEQVTWVR